MMRTFKLYWCLTREVFFLDLSDDSSNLPTPAFPAGIAHGSRSYDPALQPLVSDVVHDKTSLTSEMELSRIQHTLMLQAEFDS